MVAFPSTVDPAINAAVHALAEALEPVLPANCELVPAFSSLAIHWRPDPERDDPDWANSLTIQVQRLLTAGGKSRFRCATAEF